MEVLGPLDRVAGEREESKATRRVVEKGIAEGLKVRIRQLAENPARQDLRAMARARPVPTPKKCLALGVREWMPARGELP